MPVCRYFLKSSNGLEPSTPSLLWKFWGVTRVHARSLATDFLLLIGLLRSVEMRRETTRVSFLMCPFCVRGMLFKVTTPGFRVARRLEIAIELGLSRA